MRESIELIVRQEVSSAVKPKVSQRPAAMFSEVEDPAERLRLVEEWYRQYLIKSQGKKPESISPLLGKNRRRSKALLIKRSQQALVLAISPEVLQELIGKNNEMPFATALSRVRRNQRPTVYQVAVTACMTEATESVDPKAIHKAGKALGSLIDLDDSHDYKLSKEAIKALDETAPEMFAVAVRSLSASSLSRIVDESMLGVCSPQQTATLIGMAAGKIFVGRRGQGAASETGVERQKSMRVPLGRLLDQVIERDNMALIADDPDFGFAEAVVDSLTRANKPTFTVCKLVELADRHGENAKELLSLITPGLVQRAREILDKFGDAETFPDDLKDIGGNPDYFSIA